MLELNEQAAQAKVLGDPNAMPAPQLSRMTWAELVAVLQAAEDSN